MPVGIGLCRAKTRNLSWTWRFPWLSGRPQYSLISPGTTWVCLIRVVI